MRSVRGRALALVVGVVVLAGGALPGAALAATVRIEPTRTTMAVGDTTVLTVKLDTEGAAINTVEGAVVLEAAENVLAVQEYSLAGSALSLWPRTPSLARDAKTVSFVGGVPGGLTGEGVVLFNIIVRGAREGSVTVAPRDVIAFLHDGAGTKLVAKGRSVTIAVGPETIAPAVDDWEQIVSSDTTPPQDFVIVVGRDQALFDGQLFAYFSTTDNQSGMSYYEISEEGAPAVRTGSTYVLRNQREDARLLVTAVDKAGNKKSAAYPAVVPAESGAGVPAGAEDAGVAWGSVVLVLVLLVVGTALYKKMRKK